MPLPDDVRAAVKEYLKLNESRRRKLNPNRNSCLLQR
jgi:hypothetical protein